MKIAFNILATIILTLGSCTTYAQDCSSDRPASKDCLMIGKAKVYHSEQYTRAFVHFYLRGKASDITNNKNATIDLKNDILTMNLSYYAGGNIIPTSVYFRLTSLSTEYLKYKDNSKLTIYLEDKPLLSENLTPRNSIVIAQDFLLEMKYTDFLKFTTAKKITIQFADLKIELKPEQVEALNDLNKSTKYLHYLPYHPPM